MSSHVSELVAPFTRRSLLATGAGLTIGLFTTAARAQDGTPGAESGTGQTGGGWAFTDDRGVTVTLPERPDTIVAQTTAAAALWDYGVRVAAVIGPNRMADGSNDFQAGEIDFDAVDVLGDWGSESLELDIEKLVALQPDIVVDMAFGETFWYTDAIKSTIEQIAPMIGISMEKVSILQSIERFEELARLLGADLEAPDVVAANIAFAEAEADLKTAIAEKPNLTVLVASPGPDEIYIASPDWMTDLYYFRDLGLEIVTHTTDNFFELLSWEQANRYAADLILVDARTPQEQMDEAAKIETWASLPAVQAGQIGPWYAGAPYSHKRLAPIMAELAGLIRSCRTDVV